ncbi:ATP-binding protein [Marivirga sp.]|uniref:sensor histidine kinase n=1 Tax=Marivirga sp. TaxID=2018662 RepID=UPI0025CF2AE4|nr:ATP-binding protein [Marivirga sp.]
MKTEDAIDLYENAPCGYLTMQSDGNIIKINSTLLNWLNFERSEIVNKKAFRDFLSMGDKIYLETHFMSLLQMQGDVTEISLELIGKGTIRIPTLINAKQIQQDFNKQPVYLISVLGITHRKMYEEELLIAQKKAEETTHRLKEMNKVLERFAYTASHDLQAPLNAISGMVHILEKKNVIQAGSEEELIFSKIASNAELMKMMIRDLLEYSKIDEKSSGFEAVSLNEACNLALEILDGEVQKNEAIINIPDLPEVMGVKIQFVRLFQNLFSNAIKYRSEKNPVITLSWEKKDDFHTIYVQDNGMGFEQVDESKIFGFMERLHSHDSIAGTGIGLSACKRIVEKHGGRIGVKSNPNKGSTFYFTISVIDESKHH